MTDLSIPPGLAKDFRGPAIAASRRALQSLGPAALASPTEAGISYCIPAPADAAFLVTLLRMNAIFSLSGILMIVVGAGSLGTSVLPTWAFPLGVACWILGTLICFIPTLLEAVLLRRFLRKNLGDLWARKTHKPIHVAIENANTYNRMKVLAEDIGALVIHTDAQCIEIEGIRCRYLIYAADVIGVSLHKNGKTVLVGYLAADELLELAIIPRGILKELQRQTTGSSAGTYHAIAQALVSPKAAQ
jgi:hypothetical protein